MNTSQIAICQRYNVTPLECHAESKVGIALKVKEGILPVHGLRLRPANGTCGWYIWAGGEISQEEDFFVPLHVSHLAEWSPLIEPYLLLPPGWRFLVAPNFEDVWFDANLLERK